jgi:chromosomal replication initiator protein
MDLQNLWETLLFVLRAKLEDPRAVEVWIEKCVPGELQADTLVLKVPNRYYEEWIAENYLEAMEREVSGILARPMRVTFHTTDRPTPPSPAPEPVIEVATLPGAIVGVNARQTFNSFVIGECNKFAHAAACAVAEEPARKYNPLFIYGGTGLGKTHLMHAVGNEIGSSGSERVVYTTAEDFMNEMINALRYKNMDEFRTKYRKQASVLLVDDIQFLSGKDRTQEEFFHTFNALQTSGRQIVLTSDVSPRDIDKLMPRLRTRFEGGLLADMQAPDRETLIAILYRKADVIGLTLPVDLADIIASVVRGNIREVEGILTRLQAQHAFHRKPITVEFAQRTMPELFASNKPDVTVPQIIQAVAKLHNIRSADITGTKRTRTLTRPRQIAMFLARTHTSLSFPELGREFGGRDHSTIQHGFRKVERELADDADLSYKIRLIEAELKLRSEV